MPGVGGVLVLDLFLGEAEAAVPLAVGIQGGQEVFFPEIGPQGVGDVEFGIGRLPEEKVAQAVLAAGADHQVRVG